MQTGDAADVGQSAGCMCASARASMSQSEQEKKREAVAVAGRIQMRRLLRVLHLAACSIRVLGTDD